MTFDELNDGNVIEIVGNLCEESKNIFVNFVFLRQYGISIKYQICSLLDRFKIFLSSRITWYMKWCLAANHIPTRFHQYRLDQLETCAILLIVFYFILIRVIYLGIIRSLPPLPSVSSIIKRKVREF